MKDNEELVKLILSEKEKGNICVNTIEGLMSMPIDEIIKQPVEGLLYDLNRDQATCITWIAKDGNSSTWVNDFATALVVEKMAKELTQLRADLAAERERAEKYKKEEEELADLLDTVTVTLVKQEKK